LAPAICAGLGYLTECRTLFYSGRVSEDNFLSRFPFIEKPRRSRANLRPRSRSASVIDRLLKNQNPLKIVIIFEHPRRTLPSTDVRGTAPQFRGPKLREPWLFRSPGIEDF